MKKFRTEKIKEYDKMVARRLASIRIASGLKQSDIGKLLEMDRTNYSYIESGKNAIKLYYLMKLCNFYSISMDVITMADDESFFSFLNEYEQREKSRKQKKDKDNYVISMCTYDDIMSGIL